MFSTYSKPKFNEKWKTYSWATKIFHKFPENDFALRKYNPDDFYKKKVTRILWKRPLMASLPLFDTIPSIVQGKPVFEDSETQAFHITTALRNSKNSARNFITDIISHLVFIFKNQIRIPETYFQVYFALSTTMGHGFLPS